MLNHKSNTQIQIKIKKQFFLTLEKVEEEIVLPKQFHSANSNFHAHRTMANDLHFLHFTGLILLVSNLPLRKHPLSLRLWLLRIFLLFCKVFAPY